MSGPRADQPVSPHGPAAAAGILLVTGASRGIGAATAHAAARAGWDVAVNYVRDAAAATAVADGVRAAGRRAMIVRADVADEPQIRAMFEAVDTTLGRLTGLVNNAGVVDMKARVDEMSLHRLQRMWAINITGSFLCAREALRRMSRRHGGAGGAIVNLSSAAARLGAPGQYVDYATSKGAIDTFTLGLAREVAAEGVRVNGVRPGIIDTEIHASGGLPDRAAEMAPGVPMQRAGSAAEVAEAIVWLLSEQASYVTGTMIDVAGGR
jgi:NAD(P)-dependent dehydrogenase (short-subunit alcohol dehydrogenase family)